MTRPSSPFAPPPIKRVKIKPRKDPVTPAMRNYILCRDGGCVGRDYSSCEGPIEIDHVRASGGLGLRSPSEKSNLVSLCRWHHKAKTEYGKVWRPLLLAYLERVEVGE